MPIGGHRDCCPLTDHSNCQKGEFAKVETVLLSDQKPEPSSGAEAVYMAVDYGITKKPWSHLSPETQALHGIEYNAAVAHYRKTVPHLTLKELADGLGESDYQNVLGLYHHIVANRGEPE